MYQKKKNLITKLTKNYDYVVNLAGYVDHSKKKKLLRHILMVVKI